MREIAKQSASNLRALFLNTSGQIGLNEAFELFPRTSMFKMDRVPYRQSKILRGSPGWPSNSG